MNRDTNFDEDVRREQEVKRLLIEDEMDYWIGNPVVQIIHGQLVFDKDTSNSLVFNESIDDLVVKRRKIIQTQKESSSNALVALGIQNSRSPVEICEFFKEQPFSSGISEIRVIKTTSNIMYGMILFFLSNEACAEFLNSNFGQRFNTIEDDICILRPILSVTFSLDTYDIKNEEDSLLFSRHNSKSSSSTQSQSTSTSVQQNGVASSQQAANNAIVPKQLQPSALSLVYNLLQTDNNNQLINCAICQEQLISSIKESDSPNKIGSKANNLQQDEESSSTNQLELSPQKQSSVKKSVQDQILSIMCGHYFHSACLSKWQDSICPLCRYHQQPPELSYCDVCRSSEALWMCLVCGSINCGMEFMTQSHVKMHYEETKHTYSMEIESKFVYDHSRDTFVHRLMQNLADGKIVEIDNGNGMQDVFSNDYDKGKKGIDSLKEYEIQMSTCLEAQRKEFQAKLQEVKKQHAKKLQDQDLRKKQLILALEQEKESLESEENLSKSEEEFLNKTKHVFLLISSKKLELQKQEAHLSQKHQELGSSSEKKEEELKKKLLFIQQSIQGKIQEIKDIENHLKANKKLKEIGEDTSSSALLVLGSNKNNPKKKKKK